MRTFRIRLMLLLASVAAIGGVVGISQATPAQAVCGGGEPGEGCWCPPGEIRLPNGKTISTGINC